jgi:hypothetical protein
MKNLYTYSNTIVDAPLPLQEGGPMDGMGESDRESDHEDSSIMFDIPEEIIEPSDSGSDSSSDSDSDHDSDSDSGHDSNQMEHETHGNLPEIIVQLQKKLLKDYTLPPCPIGNPVQPTLSQVEILSLQHYLAWTESNGTVKAYNAHAQVLGGAIQEEILSLYKVRKLARELTGLNPCFVDMCPKSCMAFTGDSKSQKTCSYICNGKSCGESHYKPQSASSRAEPKPRATMLYVPITPIIQAYYANAESSHEMRHRDQVLKQTLDALAQGAGVNTLKKSEFANSVNHSRHYEELGLFRDKRDTALSISSDGAQLTMKKQSNMWLLIVVLLNLPPEMCYKAQNVIFPLAIPGPSAPGDIESFIYPLFEEMAQASVGMWTWDAVDSSYFVLKAFLCAVKGDMLGSAKLSGMAGHSAHYGDRFSLVPGARPSKEGAKYQYYPISPPEKEIHNSDRPIIDLDDLPMRGQRHYWETIERLQSAATERERKRIGKMTGISRLTLCAASPAFFTHHFFHWTHSIYFMKTAWCTSGICG